MKYKLFMLLLIVVTLPVIAQTEYKPLTRAEAGAWIDSIPREELIEFVIQADYAEHVNPVIIFPEYTAILTDKDDLVIFPLEDSLLSINIGYLSYTATMPQYLIPEFYDTSPDISGYIEIGVICVLAGVVGGFLLGRL